MLRCRRKRDRRLHVVRVAVGQDPEPVVRQPGRQVVRRCRTAAPGRGRSRSGRAPGNTRRGWSRDGCRQGRLVGGRRCGATGAALAAVTCAGTIVTSATTTSTTLAASRTAVDAAKARLTEAHGGDDPTATSTPEPATWSNAIMCIGTGEVGYMSAHEDPEHRPASRPGQLAAHHESRREEGNTTADTATTSRSSGRTSDALVSPRFCDHRNSTGYAANSNGCQLRHGRWRASGRRCRVCHAMDRNPGDGDGRQESMPRRIIPSTAAIGGRATEPR